MNFSSVALADGAQAAPLAEDEPERLAYVKECGILDTPDEESFNRLARLTAMLIGVPIAAISVVDDHRQWMKATFGSGVEKESSRQVSFCAYALLSDKTFVVQDALQDDRFRNNPSVTGAPHIRFYAGAPLICSTGYKLGAMFIIDTQPRELSDMDRRILTDFAAIAVDLIESRAKWL